MKIETYVMMRHSFISKSALRRSSNFMSEQRDAALRQSLLEWRQQTASNFRVSSCFILSEKTLNQLVQKKPLTLESLLHIDGIAEFKLAYFGQEILEVIDRFLSPGERALKEYATIQPIIRCACLCDLCDAVICSRCGIVHRLPAKEMNSTTALLHQMIRPRKDRIETLHKKRKMTAAFVPEKDRTCPWANFGEQRGEVRRQESEGRKRKREKMEVRDENEETMLDMEFWNIAARVKKRAKEALGKKMAQKRMQKRNEDLKNIFEIARSEDFAFAEVPDLDSCSIHTLKNFLLQSGYKFTGELVDATELRLLAKQMIPSWEVQRIISCETLPPEQQYLAILRINPEDGYEKMRNNFKKLSLVIHPDKNYTPEATHAFHLLQTAVQLYHRRCGHR